MGIFLPVTGTDVGEALDLSTLPSLGAGNGYRLFALGGDDTITGRTQANEPDIINAGAGNDLVNANAGNDTDSGGAGKDTLNGQAGNDSISGGTENDVINGGTENDILRGDAGDDSVNGDGGDDNVGGGDGNDLVTGGAGKDVVNGDAGNDTVDGGSGNDAVNGGAGNDQVIGGGGQDILNGGSGNDALLGGGGRDVFVFDTAGNATSAPEHDTIFDFQMTFNSQQDLIDLRAFNIGVAQLQIDQPVIGAFAQSTRTIKVDTDKDGNFNDNLIITVSAQNLAGVADSLDVVDWPFSFLPTGGDPEILI